MSEKPPGDPRKPRDTSPSDVHVKVDVSGKLGDPDIKVTVTPRRFKGIPWKRETGYLRKYVIDYMGNPSLSPWAIQSAVRDILEEVFKEMSEELGELRASEMMVNVSLEDDL